MDRTCDGGRRAVVLGAAATALAPAAWASSVPPLVAAASDLQFALPEVASAFRRRTGTEVRLVFGSSGSFVQQIRSGAPFEVFLSADEAYVDNLRAAGHTADDGRLYAVGRIGIFTPRRSPVRADERMDDLAAALRDGRLRKLAIANPAHAPYGRAAREALTRRGLWAAVQPRLVLGDNASQATQFAVSGSAQAGIIPLSLAAAPTVAQAGRFALVPEAWHSPLRQRAVVLRGAGAGARGFFDFLQGAEARRILARHGFRLPAP
jgi:molybdate transport system substrate-binding protein